jgi:hypothetical protein
MALAWYLTRKAARLKQEMQPKSHEPVGVPEKTDQPDR